MYGIGLNGSFKLRDESTIKAKSRSSNYIRAKPVSFKAETSMRDMIVSVLGAVNSPGGSTIDVIKKYIAAIYDVHEKSLNTESFHTTLNQAVSDEVVVQTLAAAGPNQSFTSLPINISEEMATEQGAKVPVKRRHVSAMLFFDFKDCLTVSMRYIIVHITLKLM